MRRATKYPSILVSQYLAFSIALIIGILFMSALWVGASAFTEPTAAAPGANTLAPLNEGSAAQVKAGALIVTNPVNAKLLRDTDNPTGAYINFTGTSYFKGKIDLGGHSIVNTAKPVNAPDIANKAYVDAGAVAP